VTPTLTGQPPETAPPGSGPNTAGAAAPQIELPKYEDTEGTPRLANALAAGTPVLQVDDQIALAATALPAFSQAAPSGKSVSGAPEKMGDSQAAAPANSDHRFTTKEVIVPIPSEQLAPLVAPAPQHATLELDQLTSAPEQVAAAVIAHAEIVARGERIEFHLQLEPPDLGTITIHLSASAHDVSGRLVVREEAARQLIEQNLQSLRQHLADAGIRLGSFSVARDGTGARNSGSEPQPQESELATESLSRSRSGRAVASVLGGLPHNISTINVLV